MTLDQNNHLYYVKKGLTLNTTKTGLYKSQKINEQLKKTIYNDVIASQNNAVDEDVRETD